MMAHIDAELIENILYDRVNSNRLNKILYAVGKDFSRGRILCTTSYRTNTMKSLRRDDDRV